MTFFLNAIELWIAADLKKGDGMPAVNGCNIAADAEVSAAIICISSNL